MMHVVLSSFVCDTSFRFYESKHLGTTIATISIGWLLIKKLCVVWRPFSKIITLVLFTLSLKPRVSQYNCISFNIDCGACGFCENNITSSANINKNICNSSTFITPSILLIIQLRISFKKKRHKILLMGSPCFTPIYELIKFEVADLYRMNDLTAEYIDLMAWMNLVLLLSAKSFCHRYILSILSNIFSQSRKAT